MKRWAWLMVLAAAPGCVILPQKVEEPQKTEETRRPTAERKEVSAPPVTPEEVNENTARACFQRLTEEVERNQKELAP